MMDDIEVLKRRLKAAEDELVLMQNQRIEHKRVLGILEEIAHSGVEYEDDRLRYVVVQIDRNTWLDIQDEFKGE